MNIDRWEVLDRLCTLTSEVVHQHFKCELPADCWCGARRQGSPETIGAGYRFDDRVLDFIEAAVRKALEAESSSKPNAARTA